MSEWIPLGMWTGLIVRWFVSVGAVAIIVSPILRPPLSVYSEINTIYNHLPTLATFVLSPQRRDARRPFPWW